MLIIRVAERKSMSLNNIFEMSAIKASWILLNKSFLVNFTKIKLSSIKWSITYENNI